MQTSPQTSSCASIQSATLLSDTRVSESDYHKHLNIFFFFSENIYKYIGVSKANQYLGHSSRQTGPQVYY